MRAFSSLATATFVGSLMVAAMSAQQAAALRRAAPPPMRLTSTSFADGARFPAKYTQAGDQTSPR